ncbi:MAG: hypothetical protein R2754_17735 [Microthrixaceae bacterium]
MSDQWWTPGVGDDVAPSTNPVLADLPTTPNGRQAGRLSRALGGRGLMIGGILGGLVAVALAAIVLMRFLGGGGASSPEAVLETMAEAVNKQDPVLAATVVDPDELPLLVDIMKEFEGVRKRSGVGTGPVAGTESSVDDLNLDVDELAPNVARVRLRDGELSYELDVSNLPQDLAAGVSPETLEERYSGSVEVSDYEDEVGSDLSAIVVRKGGGWYLSPSLTTADLLVESQDGYYEEGNFDDFGEVDFFADGAASPEEVLEELSDAVNSGDPEELAAQLPSDQGQAAAIFQDAAEQWLAEYGRDSFDPDSWDLGSTTTRTESGPDGTTRLILDSGEATYTGGTAEYKITTDGWELCGDDREDDAGRECVNALTGDVAQKGEKDQPGWGTDAPLGQLLPKVLGDGPSVLVREVDDGWKLDALATLADLGITAMKQIDRDFLESLALVPLGEVDAELALEKEDDVAFNDAGFASVSVATKPDEVYSLVADVDDPEWFLAWAAGVDDESPIAGDALSSTDDVGGGPYSMNFVAGEEDTTIGLGGLANPNKSAKVKVVPVEVGNIKLDDEVRGSLESELALYTFDADEYANYEIEFTSSDDANMSLSEFDGELSNYDLSYFYPEVESDGSGVSNGTYSAYDSGKVLVAVTGKAGTTFSFRVVEEPVGFENGSTSQTVQVRPGDTISVPFEVGDNFSSVELEVSWTTNNDIDPSLYIDGSVADSDSSSYSSCPCTDFLSGYGTGSGSVRLHSYGSTTTSVQLDLTISDG